MGIARHVLFLSIAVVAAAGCSDGTSVTSDPADMAVRPRGITTLVVVMMENRSFDHWLGARSLVEKLPGDGLAATMANPDTIGTSVPVFHDDVPCVEDPPHGWDPSHNQWNLGANDGFVKEYQRSAGATVQPHVMGYKLRDDLPVTWALADAYTTCDRWFASVMGPTWPNRMYLHSAQSGGLKSNKLPAGSFFFEWPTIYHRLNDKKVAWRYYYSDVPFLSLFKGVDPDRQGIRRIDEFFTDAAAGTLPPVVMVDPKFTENDDHPPHHPLLGQQFIAEVYAALAASPQWDNVHLVVTFDEHGGFFDHVSPPTTADDRAADGFDRLGFRVPTIVAGPYARKGYVSSTVHDHTSILAHIEKTHGLAPLTARDAAANDLSDTIDTDRLGRFEPAPPIELPKVTIDPAQIPSECKAGSDI